MRCEVAYCIYNKKLNCYLDNIEINAMGQCEECIFVSFPKSKLKKYKTKQLQAIVRRNK